MWQVKIPYYNLEEKEKIILSSFLNNSKGIEEQERELTVFFDSLNDLEGFKSNLNSKSIFIEKISEKIDWLSRWKRFHKVIKIDPFIIIPSFKKDIKVEKGKKRIIINPSFAFGTGSHPTTRMCIKFLVEVTKKGSKVLDLGCGSGILAIAAEKLGANYVLAVDIDDIALKEAKKNISKNNCKKITLSHTMGDDNNFDLIVCNILLNTILELKSDLKKSLKVNGKLILSGILEEQEEEVRKAFLKDFKLLKTRRLRDKNYRWVSFLYERT